MPAIDTDAGESCRLERLSGRTFWLLWATIILISAAFYYEKAADHRSAFVRWRPQVLQFWSGVNIYDKMLFPNPPIMPISLYPLMVLPTVAGAMCWFAIKVAMTTAVLLMCFEIVRPPGHSYPPMFRSLILLLSLRPILGDLHHGNNNLLILFLVVSMYYAWRKGWDIGAGLLLALATAYKVTPALFFLYFAYKRSWRTLSWGLLGSRAVPDHRPGSRGRTSVQRRVPGNVVAPHDHPIHRQERVELARGKPVSACRLDATAHQFDSGTGPI